MDIKLKRFIETITRFSDIPETQLGKLNKMIKSQTICKKEYFIRMEDQPKKFAFINNGVFRVYCDSEDGNEKTLAFRSEGQFIAPYTPVVCCQRVWYSIQALTDCDIYYISIADYKKMSREHVCWEVLEKNYIIELFLEKEERERSLLMDSAKVRYETFIEAYQEIERRVQQSHIASYLGITPVSLSRLKSQ